MIVKLTQPADEYPELTPDQSYLVIGIEADDLRLLNDHGQPYLYPDELFEIVDPSEPANWVIEQGDDGERYAYPAALNSPGFFEDFFEGKPEAVQTFWQTINRNLTAA
jgi:hypothetical protein